MVMLRAGAMNKSARKTRVEAEAEGKGGAACGGPAAAADTAAEAAARPTLSSTVRNSSRYIAGRRRLPVAEGSIYARYLWCIAREPIEPHEARRLARAQAYDLLVYLVFMLTTVLVATLSCTFLNPLGASRGEQDFYQAAAAIKNQLAGVEMKDTYVSNFAKVFEDIATVEEYYTWWFSAFHHTLFSSGTFDATDPNECLATGQYCMQPGSALGPVTIVGAVRVGQLRSKRRRCRLDARLGHTPDPRAWARHNPYVAANASTAEFVVAHLNSTYDAFFGSSVEPSCFGNRYTSKWSADSEDVDDYGLWSYTGRPFDFRGVYTTAERRGQALPPRSRPHRERTRTSSSYLSKSNYMYPAPAFNVLLDPVRTSSAENLEILKSLAASHYVDLQTKVVFADVVFHNPMLKSFTKVRLTAEMTRGGGVQPSYYADTVKLFYDWPAKGHSYREVLIWIMRLPIMGTFYFYYFLQGIEEINARGLRGFFSNWLNICQMCNIMIYMMAWAFRLYVAFFVLYDHEEETWRKIDPYSEDYLSLFQTACRLIRHATVLEAMNALLNWGKFCSYLSVSVTFALLTRTLGRAIKPLASFAGVFCVIFYGFAQAHCMIFHDRLHEFRTLTASSFTLLRSLLGDFDFMQLKNTEEFIGPIFFVLFVSIATLVILNMVIAIISDAYSEVDNDMKVAAREVEAQGMDADYRFHNLLGEVRAIVVDLPPIRLVRFVFHLDRAAEAAQASINRSYKGSSKALEDVEAGAPGGDTAARKTLLTKVVPFDAAKLASPSARVDEAPPAPGAPAPALRVDTFADEGRTFRSPKKKLAKYARKATATSALSPFSPFSPFSPAPHHRNGFVDPPPPAAQLQVLRVFGSLASHLDAIDPVLFATFARLSEAQVAKLAEDLATSLRVLAPPQANGNVGSPREPSA